MPCYVGWPARGVRYATRNSFRRPHDTGRAAPRGVLKAILDTFRSFLHRVLPAAWARRGALACVLWPVSVAFAALVRLRRGLYALGILQVWRAPVPVVVVGNITVGGSGKTPLLINLCQALRAAGFSPGVVSRGHGGAAQGVLAVAPGVSADLAGDEPVLIHRRTGCPVFVSRRRVQAAQALLERHPEVDVILADDGLQHLALGRDVEIVVMDARGVGNGFMLPAGPLRESVSRLVGVDAVVVNGRPATHPVSDETPCFAMSLVGAQFHNLADPGLVCGPQALQALPGALHAMAGIGHPARFFAHLRGLGLAVSEHPFPDHHAYRLEDLSFAQHGVLLMTEKDAVKCAPFAKPWMWVLRVDAVLEPDLTPKLVEWINGRKTA